MDNNNKNYILFIALRAAIGGLLFGYDTASKFWNNWQFNRSIHLTSVETGCGQYQVHWLDV